MGGIQFIPLDWQPMLTAGRRYATLFFLGVFGGLVSVFLPRMMLSLSVDPQPVRGSYLSFFHWDFVCLALGFALVIGIVSLIFELSEKRSPKEVFMAALGIPALLSGVLNTTSATNKLEKSEQGRSAAERSVSEALRLSQDSVDQFKLLGGPGPAAGGAPLSQSGFSLFPVALAQTTPIGQQTPGFDPGIRLDRSGYVVVIRAASNEQEAQTSAAQLRSTVPTAQAIKTDRGFFVIDSAALRSHPDAVRDAVRLREQNLNPSLLQVPAR